MSHRELDEKLDGLARSFGRILREDVERALQHARSSGRLSRAINGALDERRKPHGMLFWSRAHLAGVALVIVLASSVVVAGLRRARIAPAVQEMSHAIQPKIAAPPTTPAAAEVLPQEAVQEAERGPAVKPALAPAESHGARRRFRAVPATEGPAALFSRGNNARRSGHYAEATRLYARLHEVFPESAEANVSRVALGRLLVDRSQNLTRALRLFEDYLRLAPGGSLTEQALAGRVLAFRKLGRRDDEQGALQRLLELFPDSPHAADGRVPPKK